MTYPTSASHELRHIRRRLTIKGARKWLKPTNNKTEKKEHVRVRKNLETK